jgi:hypothetical protein
VPVIDQSSVRNRLLAALMADEFALLARHLHPAVLERGDVLAALDAPIRFGWFLESAVGSIIAVSPEGHRVETALFGRDGFGPRLTCPRRRSLTIRGRHPDARRRLSHRRGRAARSPGARAVAARRARLYLQTLSTQIGYTALSNAVHQIDERCARWLLMMHDRVDGDDISSRTNSCR